ncbi:hypothetical protein NJC38_02310 [Pseudomonas sp. 21LCFQ010]|uniref:hypothetical protein n=1 Tax=Pseudomonas sp. 21LCFQ010 TaxID=2957506 RepID=UPI002096AD64|nr:hypothetical protein [Pseudomonas sp. 21LCFQ010]MCO8160985.1 hypothetical protein [Pseudomonas sp. 21LCFQ010]
MKTFLSDSLNDLVLGRDGRLATAREIDAFAQSARQYMQARLGEMIHNADQGIPFTAVLWGGTPSVAQFEAAGRVRLMQVPGALAVVSFTARLQGDVIAYDAMVNTQWGEVTING